MVNLIQSGEFGDSGPSCVVQSCGPGFHAVGTGFSNSIRSAYWINHKSVPELGHCRLGECVQQGWVY